jgi:hypothetical protein
MNTTTRCGKKWTVTECLQLQREYELLGLSVDEIAQLHKRSNNAIMFKLDQEGFCDYNSLYTKQEVDSSKCKNALMVDQDVLETKIDYLVSGLEPKLLEEMRQECERCEQLLKKMRYFTELGTQSKNRLSMSMY